jgi:hypothetical protein
MITPKLNDSQIFEMKEEFKKLNLGIQKLCFKYTANSKDLFVDAIGVEGIPQAEDYYDNIEDHLTYTDLTWLSTLCNKLQVNFDATVEVFPDGTFNHSEIHIELNPVIIGRNVDKGSILSFFYPFFKKLMPLKSNIQRVEFKGHDYSLRKMTFSLVLDGKKVNVLLSDNQGLNHQSLSQWIATLEHVLEYNKGRYKYITTVPMVNGRMSTASFESAICFKFDGKGGRR